MAKRKVEKKRKRREQEEASDDWTSAKEVKKRIVPVSDSTGNKITSLIYGRSGTGKTSVAATLADIDAPDDINGEPVTDGDRILMIDIREEGTDSIATDPKIDVFSCRSWADYEGAYWFLADSEHPYKGVMHDTVTQLQNLAMNEAKLRAKIGIEDAMTKRSWGFLGSLLVPLLVDFRDLPYHSAFIAQDRHQEAEEADDDDELIPETGPAIMPSVARTVNAMVKVIGQTHMKQKEVSVGGKMKKKTIFKLRVGPHPYYITKLRVPRGMKTPLTIVDPNFAKVQAIMRGEYGKNQEK